MSDYSAVAPPTNFSQSSAFAAALQRARQIAAKINPIGEGGGQKRPLEDNSEPEAKKLAGEGLHAQSPPQSAAAAQAAAVAARVAAAAAAGLQGLGVGVPGLPLVSGSVQNEDVRVPDKMVGLIIGRGGEQISRLQNESGCKIQMAPDSNGMPDRACTLTGSREAINRAKELIMNIVHQRSRTEGTGGGGGGGGGGGMGSMGDMNMGGNPSGMAHVEIMVPGPKVGLIIGKGGETIKQLQEKSGAKMVIIQDGPTQEQEKPLRISGDAQKVEYAKQLVYDLIAEKEMQRGGGNRGGGSYDDYGDGEGSGDGNSEGVEVAVPRAAVGVVIGKGGDMIKKIQNETGARVQFQQGRDDGPGERRCLLSGKPAQVEQARRRIEELIDSRRDNEMGRGRGRGAGMPRDFGNGSNGGGWEGRRPGGGMGGGGDKGEATFTIPAAKCGIVIGRGGETIKQINQQTGAHCELDRRPPANPAEKIFIIRGSPEQIEAAKRIISEKIGMPPGPGGGQQTQYPIGQGGQQGQGPPQHFPQGWGGGYQPWQGQQHPGGDPSGGGGGPVQVNPSTGQPDYSVQWAEYYRSLGMVREAEMIEAQAKQGMGGAPGGVPQQAAPVKLEPMGGAGGGGGGAQNGAADYSAQWAEYYRSIGKVKEAEAIEAQMKGPKGGNPGAPGPSPAGAPSQPGYSQPGYNYQPAPGGYYPGQPGGAPQPGQQPGQQFGYPGGPAYAYPGQPQDNQ